MTPVVLWVRPEHVQFGRPWWAAGGRGYVAGVAVAGRFDPAGDQVAFSNRAIPVEDTGWLEDVPTAALQAVLERIAQDRPLEDRTPVTGVQIAKTALVLIREGMDVGGAPC